jgi:hypothetical protein
MKRVLILMALVLAACGGGNEGNAGHSHNEGHGHDHIHSHAGKDVALPELKVGPWTLKPNLKDEVKRGGTTIIELHFTGAPTDGLTFKGTVEDDAGNEILKGLAQHNMAEEGKFAVHLGLKPDAPKNLTMRLTVEREGESHEAVIPLP